MLASSTGAFARLSTLPRFSSIEVFAAVGHGTHDVDGFPAWSIFVKICAVGESLALQVSAVPRRARI